VSKSAGTDTGEAQKLEPVEVGSAVEMLVSGQAAATIRDVMSPTAGLAALSTSSAEMAPDPLRVRFPPAPTRDDAAPGEFIITTVEWEGYVEEVQDERFLAMLVDKTTGRAERTTVLFDEVSSFDLDLVEPGAVFYWSVGYRVRETRQREGISLIRFRRLPTWTARELTQLSGSASVRAAELQWDDEVNEPPE
jgi:hypothetical protein